MRYLLLFLYIILLNNSIFGIHNKDQHDLGKLVKQGCLSVTEINSEAGEYAKVILPNLLKNTGLSKKYLAISTNSMNHDHERKIAAYAIKNEIEYAFWQINDSYIEIEPTDLLILNSLRTYHHMSFALKTFAKNVCKCICIPNVSTKGQMSDKDVRYEGNFLEYPIPYKQSDSQGIYQAIVDFCALHPEWSFKSQFDDDLLVLNRIALSNYPVTFNLDPKVDFYLKNKIILCTGPSFGNYQMLQSTVEAEMNLIPYKKIFIRTNDDKILDLKFAKLTPVTQRIPCIEKYVDCWNCIITSLTDAVNDPEVKDDDIVLFKHETVFLNDLGLFKRAINTIISGFDGVARIFWGGTTSDIFLLKVSAIRKMMHQFSPLTKVPDDEYVEMMLHTKIISRIPNIYCIKLGEAPLQTTNISSWGANAFGFYHLHHYFKLLKPRNLTVDIFAQKFWQKENYFTLFDKNHQISKHKFYPSVSTFYVDAIKIVSDSNLVDLNQR